LIVADTFIDRLIRDLKPFRFDPRYTQPIDVVARERRCLLRKSSLMPAIPTKRRT
jgi:hypothetical protein